VLTTRNLAVRQNHMLTDKEQSFNSLRDELPMRRSLGRHPLGLYKGSEVRGGCWDREEARERMTSRKKKKKEKERKKDQTSLLFGLDCGVWMAGHFFAGRYILLSRPGAVHI
jgi:hypothetical protein